jgi:hypothetical protein
MIEEQIGSQAFVDAQKLVYRSYIGKQVGWAEWLQAFETTSHRDLSTVIPEWIDRAGAPELGIRVVNTSRAPQNGMKKVSLSISQNGSNLYHLRIPIVIQEAVARHDTTIVLDRQAINVDLVAPEGGAILVDPDYHLFRRLYPEEVEPIISAVLGSPQQVFVSGSSNAGLDSAFQEFASGVAEDSARIVTEDELSSISTNTALIWMNPNAMPPYIAERLKFSHDSIAIGNTNYPREGHSFFLSGQGVEKAQKYWVILTDDAASLPRLGQLVPHYGKYSYLVFDGAKNIAKGQWEVSQSPLRVVVQ